MTKGTGSNLATLAAVAAVSAVSAGVHMLRTAARIVCVQ